VVDGKVLGFSTHDQGVTAPDPTGLENGLYGYRSQVTPLGEKLLPNYRFISPMFTDDGYDEAGNPIGYDLFDVAATNTPFQDNVAITFHKNGVRKMGDDLYKKLGLSDGASADEMKGAMAKYMADTEDKMKTFGDLEAKLKKYEDEKAAAAAMADAPPKDDDDDKDAKAKMAKTLGLPAGTKLSMMSAALDAKMVPMSRFAEAEQRLAAIEAERAGEKKALQEEQFAALADRGISYGYPKEKRDDLIKFARADFAAAKSFIDVLPGARLMTRYTSGGQPIADGQRQPDIGPRMAKVGGVEIPVRGATLAEKARAYAKQHNCDLAKAQLEVLRTDPAAVADYVG